MKKQESENKTICGRCLHHRYINGEWICNNPDSECYGDYTEYNDGCEEFETRINTKEKEK